MIFFFLYLTEEQHSTDYDFNMPTGYLREGADKSFARPTSRCCRTESIVSLERGVSACAELQSFLVTEAKRKHVR
jgi:hypothetical protein